MLASERQVYNSRGRVITAEKARKPRTPTAIQEKVVAMRYQGATFKDIARATDIAPDTVIRILRWHATDEKITAAATVVPVNAQVNRIIPKALSSVEDKVDDDGYLAMRFLERTIFADTHKGKVELSVAVTNAFQTLSAIVPAAPPKAEVVVDALPEAATALAPSSPEPESTK